jgi:uncharacterized membrane protein YqjE
MTEIHPATQTTSGAHSGTEPRGAGDPRSLGEIVSDISTDLTTLIRQEMDLAKVELKQEFSKAGKGAGMLGGAGVAGLMVLIFLSLALTYLLDNWMPIELAALITAVLWGVIAAVLAKTGKKELDQSNPQLPKTQQSLKGETA